MIYDFVATMTQCNCYLFDVLFNWNFWSLETFIPGVFLFVRFYFIIDAVVFIQTVGVSAATGDGLPEFFSAIDAAAAEYERLLAH